MASTREKCLTACELLESPGQRPLRGPPQNPGGARMHRLVNPATPAIQRYFAQANSPEARSGEEWTLMPEVPSAEEILGLNSPDDTVYLPANKIDGPWTSRTEYLRAHYNLIREDAIAPLRDAVAFVRYSPTMADTKDICIYEKVYITRVTLTNRGIAFRIRFSTRRAGKKILWQYSSRLITGSIVALTPAKDLFSSKCVVATVAARPLENVQKDPPEVDIFFANADDVDFDPQQEWVMVEARSGYFEAYRHTMTGLQKLSKESFPLSNHICGLDEDVKVPEYVKNSPLMGLGGLSGNPDPGNRQDNGPEDVTATSVRRLDASQETALQEMLTKKLAIIQGPPGTGKTFVSIVALKLLLANMHAGDPPIVIASQTNHALDQLINQVSSFEPNYIRLGGRSNEAEIRKRTLYAIRNSQPNNAVIGGIWGSAKSGMRGVELEIVDLLRPFSTESFGGHLSASTFVSYGFLTEEQEKSLIRHANWIGLGPERVKDPFANWLGDQLVELETGYSESNFTDNEIDEEYEKLGQIEAGQGSYTDAWEELKGRVINLRATFRGTQSRSVSQDMIEQHLRNGDLWKIPARQRGAVYNLLRSRLVEVVQQELRSKVKRYMDCCRNAKIGLWEKDHNLLKDTKLIAMTTTGLSKYRALISSLNSRVVLIEEAAEVIEAHVVTACFESVQQLILVGDHQQLKGNCAVTNLSGDPFFLDTSMFERLVRNNMPFVILREQRRMTPEIRQLLSQFYDDLRDHASVHTHDSVPGMGDCRSFFYTHDWPESGDSLMSRVNEIEAVMIVNFYNYLLLNNVPPEKITIVTFYNGQRKMILKIMKTAPSRQGFQPKVTTVDSYQGEENDIVLLSLVRSNGAHGIGFLGSMNRICVALSRAKRGLFIFGNGAHLSAVSESWRNVIAIMDARQGFGDALPVTCSKHSTVTEIKGLGDWDGINGGCKRRCEEKLRCGHECQLLCHGFPHSWVECSQGCKSVQNPVDQHASGMTQPALTVERQDTGTLTQWRKFARDGAKRSDAFFGTLVRAKDASSPEVKEAIENVDPRLIPARLKNPVPQDEKSESDLRDIPVGILID